MRLRKGCAAFLTGVLFTCIAGCENSGELSSNTVVSLEYGIHEETAQIVSAESSETESDVQSEPMQSDAELEEELGRYRKEREELIQEAGGLVEGGTPDEKSYSFDLSGALYESQFDTKELTEAYAAARIYVTDTLGIEPPTKMTVYMCIDPRILAIYTDEDKGVAAGYDNSNIFVCEYCDESGVWQYLILTREKKGSAWNVIYNGDRYKK